MHHAVSFRDTPDWLPVRRTFSPHLASSILYLRCAPACRLPIQLTRHAAHAHSTSDTPCTRGRIPAPRTTRRGPSLARAFLRKQRPGRFPTPAYTHVCDTARTHTRTRCRAVLPAPRANLAVVTLFHNFLLTRHFPVTTIATNMAGLLPAWSVCTSSGTRWRTRAQLYLNRLPVCSTIYLRRTMRHLSPLPGRVPSTNYPSWFNRQFARRSLTY